MPVNSENQLKFQEGSITEPLTVMNAGNEELPFGSKYVVHIKQTIEGFDHFMPSDGLVNKMKEENVDIGDKITIEKVAKSEKYPYGYFTVKVVEKNAPGNKEVMDQYATGEIKTAQPTHKSIEKFEEQFNEPKKDDKIAVHELDVRVEKLETIVAILWTDYSNRTSDAGHKTGDETLPF